MARRVQATDGELARIERQLEARRRTVKAALKTYPAPITACDAQYNHLAEERRRLAADLALLARARTEIVDAADAARLDALRAEASGAG